MNFDQYNHLRTPVGIYMQPTDKFNTAAFYPRYDSRQINHQHSISEYSESVDSAYQLPSKQDQIEATNKRYFEKKLNDRRIRTFEVLKQFDKEIANTLFEMQPTGPKLEKPFLRHVIKIQAAIRRFLARRRCKERLVEKLIMQDESSRKQEAFRMQQWELEQEN